jgi:hypothetical protein
MKNQNKPKIVVKSTKVVAKKSTPAKPTVKTTKTVIKPKSVTKKVTIKTPEPTYKNLRMGVNNDNKAAGQMFEQKPTKSDSASYKYGYNLGLKGVGASPYETNTVRMGRWEGQNVKPKSKKK